MKKIENNKTQFNNTCPCLQKRMEKETAYNDMAVKALLRALSSFGVYVSGATAIVCGIVGETGYAAGFGITALASLGSYTFWANKMINIGNEYPQEKSGIDKMMEAKMLLSIPFVEKALEKIKAR